MIGGWAAAGLTPWMVVGLLVAALSAGFVDAIAGGGTADVTWRQDGLPETLRLDPVKDAVDDELTVSVLAFAPAG